MHKNSTPEEPAPLFAGEAWFDPIEAAMHKNSTPEEPAPLFAGEVWFDPIEAELRERVRGFLEEMIEQEATAALGRSRYQRGAAGNYRNGTRSRRLLGSFGPIEITVPRARLFAADGTS